MAIKMMAEYKGYTIEWSGYRFFTISQDGTEVKTEVKTIEDCEKWIDNKSKQKFKRIPAISRERWGGNKMVEGEATSVVDNEYVWFVAKNGERSKVKASEIWLATPGNIKIMEVVRNKEAEIADLLSGIKELVAATDRLTVEMMID